MKARIIRVGNSRGIRIPKTVLEQTGIQDEVELLIEDNQIIIRSAPEPRRGWDEAFAEMASRKDDRIIDEIPPVSEWDETEWEW